MFGVFFFGKLVFLGFNFKIIHSVRVFAVVNNAFSGLHVRSNGQQIL